MPAKILVLDDDPVSRRFLDKVLSEEGYAIQAVPNAASAQRLLGREKFDLLIFDRLLPGIAGEEFCQTIRRDKDLQNIPILVMTGLDADGMGARLLNLGADDVITKPFEEDELLAHVRALLRRSPVYHSGDFVVRAGRLTIHVGQRRVMLNGKSLGDFAPKEFELLRHIVERSPNVMEKSQLAQQIWGMSLENLHCRTLDVHIQRIRKKLGQEASSCLKTVHAVGYQWTE